MKILVSGCCGYIGSVLVGRLLEEFPSAELTGVDNLHYEQYGVAAALVGLPRFELVRADVRTREFLALAARADLVVHLAALVGAPVCARHPKMSAAVNRDATVRLVRSLSSAQRVVYACTNSIYGSLPDCQLVDERTATVEPLSEYARDKYAAEQEVLGHPRGLSLRLATVYGASPRMRLDLLVNSFTEQVLSLEPGRHLEVYEGHFVRNAAGVRDVARAVCHLVQLGERGVYHVANPEGNRTKLELAHRVCDVLGLDRFLIREGEGKDPDGRNCAVSSGKLVATGFTFHHGLAEGIREVAALCRLAPPGVLREWRNA